MRNGQAIAQLCWFGSTTADARLICGNQQNLPVNRDAADEDDSEDGEGQELAHIRLRWFKLQSPRRLSRCYD
jgi:hypothetical protein